jgi:hypothetical protein
MREFLLAILTMLALLYGESANYWDVFPAA